MDLNQLEYFVHVAELGGFTRAAHELGIAQPTLSRQVRKLLESALAKQGLKAKVALEIESVPAMLDLVQTSKLKAVLALNVVQSGGRQAEFEARPISPPKLATTLWIATSAQRPSGPLIEQSAALLKELLLRERA